jgi:hypothetical protein
VSEKKEGEKALMSGKGDTSPNNTNSEDDKKKKKKSKQVSDADGEVDGSSEPQAKMDTDTLCKSLAHLSASSSPAAAHSTPQQMLPAAPPGQHAFWATQPMRKPDGWCT